MTIMYSESLYRQPMRQDHLQSIPRMYTKRPFWQFLLDTNERDPYPSAPRFKHFAENLRNFAVAGAMLKAAQNIRGDSSHFPLLAGKWFLIALALVVAGLCVCQQFGLLTLAFHHSVGWSWADHHQNWAGSKSDQMPRRQRINDGSPSALLKFAVAVTVPILFVWAMASFVLSPN